MLSRLRQLAPRVVPVAKAAGERMNSSLADSGPKKIVACLYEGGEAAKNPKLLGCVENCLGIREWLESKGHTLITTSSKEPIGESEVDKHLEDADVIITTPFHPAYLTKERLQKAKKLKLALTAGVGSDHVDLQQAVESGITVAEVTGCNVVSVAEHVLMHMLCLVRNFVPAHDQVVNGEWDVAAIADRAYDLEGKVVGTVGAGRIGQRVLRRLRGFDCEELLYFDLAKMSDTMEKELDCRYVDLKELVQRCDIITINVPLHKTTEHLFDDDMIGQMKKGAYLVNTARGKICKAESVAKALESGHLAGYAGDVWYPQPAPKDHPWRKMPFQAMTPHYSGTTLDAQERYAKGVRDILERSFEGRDLNPADVIVQGGKLAPQYGGQSDKRTLEFEKGWEKQRRAAISGKEAEGHAGAQS